MPRQHIAKSGTRASEVLCLTMELAMRLLTSMILSLALVAQAAPLPPPANHPILGIWHVILPDNGCVEVHRFRGDGTTLVTSAAEVSESEYLIPDKPSARGYYKLTGRVVKDNGKRDCSGIVMEVGATATAFILFHPSGALFLMCTAEAMETCIGPFRRVVGEPT
jgi:hypothetical protein